MRITLRGIAVATAVLLCLVPLSTAAGSIPSETSDGEPSPAGQPFQISISGGLGINVTVTNIGDHPVENLSWAISLSGLIFGGIYQASGVNPVLEPGESFSAFLLPFGLGPGSLDVEVNGVVESA
ncbi:MAG: hypothetical protein R6U10_06395, partial [Thermoplasmatota archaeon]